MKHLKLRLNKIPCIAILVAANILFIIAHLYQYSSFIRISYTKQKQEKKLLAQQEKKEELIQQLEAIKDRTTIKKYARGILGMSSVKLSQIKKLAAIDKEYDEQL